MAQDRRADPNCPHCQGTGAVIEGEKVDEHGDYWCNWLDCICIPINPISAELSRILGEALQKYQQK